MQGEFHWHQHEEQDEFFFVLDGLFRIEVEGRDTVELAPRQAFTVPAGMLHRPVVPVRSAVLMIEKPVSSPPATDPPPAGRGSSCTLHFSRA